ncbi:MAG: chorismate synthase [Firmicutes bacterium]|nr:chorismate synthase [Bacillota bacterium]
MSSQIGKKLRISVFGESHGNGIGAVIDGFPAGVVVNTKELMNFMARRAPGRDKTSTQRRENDLPTVLSGIQGNITCGTPIAAVIKNSDQQSGDYRNIAAVARPGHADYTGYLRYQGFNDIRGGGHFSARLTAPLAFAGGLCRQYLAQKDIYIGAHLKSVGSVHDDAFNDLDISESILRDIGEKNFPVLNEESEEKMREVIEKARSEGDSVGGVVEVAVSGMPAGIGSPIFDTVEGRLAYGYYGIPAVKGVEFGAGFGATLLKGSENNDEFYVDNDGAIKTKTNNHGGILGGISSGMPIIARIAFKPTPSISKPQHSVNYRKNTNTEMVVKGRHDPCVAVRAVPVVEAMTAIVIMDMLLEQEGE